MFVCQVVGSIVATAKDQNFSGAKLLLVQRRDLEGKLSGDVFVAQDTVGAGAGEVVLVTTGGSAHATEITRNSPTDAAIVGIVDNVEVARVSQPSPGEARKR